MSYVMQRGREQFRPLDTVFGASSLVMVGASERGKWPAVIVQNLREGGYAGRLDVGVLWRDDGAQSRGATVAAGKLSVEGK